MPSETPRWRPLSAIAPQNTDGDKTVYNVRARKTGGNEGFLLVFGYEDEDSYYWWNVGGWGNTAHGIERRVGGTTQKTTITLPGSIESNQWYDLKVELGSGRIRCYIDDKLIHDFRPTVPKIMVSPTLRESTGEVMVKLVNPACETMVATVRLEGELRLGSEAYLTTLAGPPKLPFLTDRVDSTSAVEVQTSNGYDNRSSSDFCASTPCEGKVDSSHLATYSIE